MKKPIAENPKKSVTLKAAILRINRKLKDDNEVVKVARGKDQSHGSFYRVDLNINGIVGWLELGDLEELGRNLDCIKPYEEITEN